MDEYWYTHILNTTYNSFKTASSHEGERTQFCIQNSNLMRVVMFVTSVRGTNGTRHSRKYSIQR
jgi:hypothetical protein